MAAEKTQEQFAEEQLLTTMAWMLQIMKKRFGDEVYEVFLEEEGRQYIEHWKGVAKKTDDHSIEALIKKLWEPLRASGGYDYTVEETEAGFQIKCTKCRPYDIAKENGLTEQVFYMGCEIDPFIAEGFNPNIGLKRTKTLMHGDEYCDHFYYYKEHDI